MHKLLPAARQLPLYSAASTRLIEAAAPPGLMERAGLAVARLALALHPGDGTIWIACGPGNNGGDGLVAARLLHQHGRHVLVSLAEAHKVQPADAALAMAAAQAAGVPTTQDPSPPVGTSLAIDALLGLGLSRPPGEAMAAAITALNVVQAPRLAIDLPSGLHADTGTAGTAVHADHTLSLLTLKPGLFTGEGRARSGELWFDDLGVTPSLAADAHLLGRIRRKARSHASHKGSHGDAMILGGSKGMQGAALLAVRAALAAGAGRVYGALDPARPEVMLQPEPLIWPSKTVIAGCGGGTNMGAILADALRHAERLVLDADALNNIACERGLQTLLRRRAAATTILTPHPLEAARLLGSSTAGVQADRLSAAQTLVARFHCTVILKGSGTVIASLGHTPCINSSGSASLATAGTGDVLAGWLGGLWAQSPDTDPHALACETAYWHGLAGETQAAGPLRAADLVERMHALHGSLTR